jgi:hypothetical protein
MSAGAAYVAIAVGALAILAVLLFVVGRGAGTRRLTPLAGLSLACVVCGIVFGEERVLAYAFFAVGILLAVVDAVRRTRAGHRNPQ